MSKRFLITLVTLLLIAGAATLAVYLAKGYTFSSKDGKLVGTGIISVSSVPDGASVYIDGHLSTATNTTISQLSPKSYNLKIIKEGFIPWEKQVEIKVGLVSEVKATLFPALPTIYPLTFNGVISPVMSSDGQKLAFGVPTVVDSQHARQKGGVWVWTFTSQPISFNRGAEPHQLISSTTSLDFSKAKFRWSPDSKQLLVTLQEGGLAGDINQRNYLLPADRNTSISDLKDITPLVDSTLKGWEEDEKVKEDARVLAITDLRVKQVASSSAVVKWSPDETKFLAGNVQPSAISPQPSDKQQKKSDSLLKGFKVYDLPLGQISQGSNNGKVTQSATGTQVKEYSLPEALAYYWLPDSKHVILVQEDKVSICEFDGSNVAVIYAGSFDKDSIFSWPDSSRLVVTTSFNTPTASTPNLFGINLK